MKTLRVLKLNFGIDLDWSRRIHSWIDLDAGLSHPLLRIVHLVGELLKSKHKWIKSRRHRLACAARISLIKLFIDLLFHLDVELRTLLILGSWGTFCLLIISVNF